MFWSVAMTRPPASGMPLRTSVSRWSAARSTLGIHSPGRRQRGAPGLGDGVLGHRFAEPGGDLVARLGAPAHVPAVGQEDDRPHDVVAQRVAVAVGVVGDRAPDPVGVLGVLHERDGVGVGAERRAGQREPAGGRLERLEARLAPGLGVAGVVDLVQDHQGLALLAPVAVQHRPDADARVGDRDAVVLLRDRARAVLRVELDADPGRRLRPLLLQVLGRGDDGDLLDDVVVQQVRGEGQREGRLAGARGRHRQEVPRLARDIRVQRALLPGAQPAGGAPGGTAGIGGREVMGGGSTHGLLIQLPRQRHETRPTLPAADAWCPEANSPPGTTFWWRCEEPAYQ